MASPVLQIQYSVFGLHLSQKMNIVVSSLLFFTFIQTVSSIGCFVCSSINGSQPACEDTFNNTANYYQRECMAARAHRVGLFPGIACIKMTAQLDDYRVTVRDCTVDTGGTNSETELGRESHCWMVNEVRFNNRKMKGCSVACMTDGCNLATAHSTPHLALLLGAGMLFLGYYGLCM